MRAFTRRGYLQSSLGALAAARSGTAGSREPRARGIQLTEVFAPGQHSRMRLAVQTGLNYAIATVAGRLSQVPRNQYLDTLAAIKNEFASHGLKIAGVESDPVPTGKIKLGLDGRDEEIENYLTAIDALGKLEIPLICWNFMAGLGWYRTNFEVRERGGALTSEFRYEDAQRQGLTQWGEVPEEKMWNNITYFLKAVIPAAEKAGVRMALHPDDPPISPLRGIARIVTSAANYRRILNIVPSPVNGITFCQANFKAMGEDIYSLAETFCREGKVFFVHYRDIEGQGRYFRETFHDNGPTDMVRMLQIYHDAGFRGPIRPDHAPTMEGESNENPGYAMIGKILAFGYMKGIMEARGIPYE